MPEKVFHCGSNKKASQQCECVTFLVDWDYIKKGDCVGRHKKERKIRRKERKRFNLKAHLTSICCVTKRSPSLNKSSNAKAQIGFHN